MIELIAVAAVLLSPLMALQVSQILERVRERRQRQLYVFRTLMATRASGLAPEHVQALNMIDIEFHGSDGKSKAVLNAWKAYLDHLGVPQTDSAVWGAKREDLFVDLLYEMSQYLEYDFDKTHIRRTSYFPKGFGELELDQYELRKGVLALVRGERSLPMFITGMNQPELEAGTDAPQIPLSAAPETERTS